MGDLHLSTNAYEYEENQQIWWQLLVWFDDQITKTFTHNLIKRTINEVVSEGYLTIVLANINHNAKMSIIIMLSLPVLHVICISRYVLMYFVHYLLRCTFDVNQKIFTS